MSHLAADSDVVVVGASAAGLSAAESLRRAGFEGNLTLVDSESELPYDRPPLSKQILKGEWQPERVRLRNQEALDGLSATWLMGIGAESVDVEKRVLSLTDGRSLSYDGLVIATGVTPRNLPIAEGLSGVHRLRTLDDALRLRAAMLAARTIVVVGAGFLGVEVAAVARELGLDVTVVDPLSAPLVRQLGQPVADKCLQLHADRGAKVLCGRGVEQVLSRGRAVRGVVLDNGRELPADLVLVAIGSVPAVDWLSGSGLTLDNGIVCDEFCEAAPGVVAAGDVACWPHPRYGYLRVEHRLNATEHGAAAAMTLLGKREPFAPVPYFWTDQYDVKIQAYGVPTEGSEFQVVEGELGDERFAALYSDGKTVTAALTWNMPRAAVKLRAKVMAELPWSQALSD
jgi:3-phenylpropionate/trans-cinnamate dioxygenase ferredoxin reductase subunit